MNLKNLNLVLVFGLGFVLFYIMIYTYENVYLDIFTDRDIRRALGWLKGNLYLPGPEMSLGGSLPGPFFYFLLFPPLLFGGNIYSKFLIWQIAWLALSYTTAFYFTGKICKHKESLFIFIMFFAACVGPSLFFLIFYAANPVFSIIFHILAIMALYTWKETDQNKYLYLLGLTVGLGVQVHLLVSVHILTAFILFFIKKKKPWQSFLWFIGLIFLPCLPYLSLYNFYVLEAIKSAINNFRFFNVFVLFPSGLWGVNFHIITSFIPYLIGPVFFFLLLFLYKTWLKKIFPLSSSSINLFIIIAPAVCIPGLGAGYPWYTHHIPVLLMLLFSKLCDDLMPDNPDKKLNYLVLYGVLFVLPFIRNVKDIWPIKIYPEHLVIIGLFLILVCLIKVIKNITYYKLGKISILLIITFLHFFSRDYTKNISHYFPYTRIFPTDTFNDHWTNYYIHSRYRFVKPVLKQIALDTDWATERAIKRVYIIGGINRDVSLWAFYSLVKEQLKNTRPLNQSKFQIRGYFVVEHLKQFISYIRKDWKEYLSHSPYVSSFIQKEIKTGKVLLQDPKLYDRYWLIPYKLTKASVFSEAFSNIGQPYYWEEPHWLKTCRSTKSFIRNNYDFYYCMVLSGQLQRAGVHITFSEETNKLFIEVSFFGPMLGLKQETTSVDGYSYWSDIQVSLFCNNDRHVYSMPNIGYNPKFFVELIASKSLNAPLKLKIPINCKKAEITKVNLKFKHWKRRFFNYSNIISEQKDIIWNIL